MKGCWMNTCWVQNMKKVCWGDFMMLRELMRISNIKEMTETRLKWVKKREDWKSYNWIELGSTKRKKWQDNSVMCMIEARMVCKERVWRYILHAINVS